MAFISRAEWGARPPRSRRPLGRVDTVIVHHTAGASGPDEAEQVRGAQNYHMDRQAWSDIAYHYLVGQSGNVYEGRGYGTMGGATLDWNERSYAICFIGNSDNDTPTDEAINAIAWIIGEGINGGHVAPGPTVIGHRDAPGNATACPGGQLAERLGDIAARVGSVAAPPPAPAPGPQTVWGPGSRGQKVVEIQQIVNASGCDAGPADGIYGPRTAAGVRCFQAKLGVTADGIWGPQTDRATGDLLAWLAAQPAPAPAPEPGVDYAAIAAALDRARRQMLRRGSKGEAVFWLQACLNNNGSNLEQDGDFGPMTERAVKAYQRANGLTVDGIVGPQTWGALLG